MFKYSRKPDWSLLHLPYREIENATSLVTLTIMDSQSSFGIRRDKNRKGKNWKKRQVSAKKDSDQHMPIKRAHPIPLWTRFVFLHCRSAIKQLTSTLYPYHRINPSVGLKDISIVRSIKMLGSPQRGSRLLKESLLISEISCSIDCPDYREKTDRTSREG